MRMERAGLPDRTQARSGIPQVEGFQLNPSLISTVPVSVDAWQLRWLFFILL